MKQRWIIYIIFVVIIAIWSGVTRYLVNTPKGGVYISDINLPINARLTTNHIRASVCRTPVDMWRLPDMSMLDGKYVAKHPIPEGGIISITNLSARPNFGITTNDIIIFLPAQLLQFPKLCEIIDVGAKVAIYDSEKNMESGPYPIEGTIGGRDTNTVFAIRIPKPDSVTVCKIAKPQLRLVAIQ